MQIEILLPMQSQTCMILFRLGMGYDQWSANIINYMMFLGKVVGCLFFGGGKFFERRRNSEEVIQ
jgi:hypothetical protein